MVRIITTNEGVKQSGNFPPKRIFCFKLFRKHVCFEFEYGPPKKGNVNFVK